MPVLWVTGAGGVGKSTASWQLFTEFSAAGVRVAFADTDQFCMCYPAPAGDPGRERLKAQNLNAAIPHYAAAGARYVIANGVVDPARGLYSELLPNAAVTACRLRADRDEIVRRLTERTHAESDLAAIIAQTLEESDAMDASDFADVCIDTTHVPAADVAALIRDRCADWPGFRDDAARPEPERHSSAAGPDPDEQSPAEQSPAESGAAGNVLLICGPSGVGKSAIGFGVYLRHLTAGLTAAYVDLDQLAFVRPPTADDPDAHRLKARTLAAFWATYRRAGATQLVTTGPVDSAAALAVYADALAGANLTVVRLHADEAELTHRIGIRAEGGSWPQPGDPLRGQPAAVLADVVRRSVRDAALLDQTGIGDLRVDTTDHSEAESAELIMSSTR